MEEVFGRGKVGGMLGNPMYRGLRLVTWISSLRMAVCNPVRLSHLEVTAV